MPTPKNKDTKSDTGKSIAPPPIVTAEMQVKADPVGAATMEINRGITISKGTVNEQALAKLVDARHQLAASYPLSPLDRPNAK